MYPVVRTMTIIGMMTLAMASLTGCGEKRIHVATLSGSPGTPTELDGAQTDTTSNTQGLPTDSVKESNLLGGNGVTETKPTPVAETASLGDSPETQPENPAANTLSDTSPKPTENEGGLLEEGASLNTQSSSSPQEVTSTEFGHLPQASFNDLGGADTQTASLSDQGPSADEIQPEPPPLNGTESNMEEIPGGIQVAKAEPSETIHEQLEHMKSQELAAATAGLEDVFFQFDSWTLTGEGKQALERSMEWLKNDPSATLLIEGHADQRGTQAYNMILGKKRAAAIRDYLNELGVDQSRLAVISYGKDKPFCQDPTEVCYQLNRRGHLLVQSPQ